MGDSNNKYVVQLDGIRFFAVLMVMMAHWLRWTWSRPFLLKMPFTHGVTLFFVLSGYLITRILLENKETNRENGLNQFHLLKNFYIRRFFRIFPIYYLLVFGLYLFNYKNTAEIFPWLVSYTSNIYQSINNVAIGDFNHFWSLAVEEQFYLFWPLLILFIDRKRTLPLIIATIVIALCVRTYLFLYVGKWMATSYFTLSCMHSLGLGALMAYIKTNNTKLEHKLSRPFILYIVLAVYLAMLIAPKPLTVGWYKEIVDEFFFAVVAFFIILRASENRFKGLARLILENKFVVYSGKISYGLYIYHMFMPALLNYILGISGYSISNKYIYFVTSFFLTFAVATISWKIIEQPINKLKNRVPYIVSYAK
jgi:peptidoglycan/LPS O-acetylase OafA/YrhL